MGRLQNKVAIITGGASGIGAQIVERFLAEDATVVIADINVDKIKETDSLVAKQLDVTSEEGWDELTKSVYEQFGRIDILVNNAGVSTEVTLDNLDYEDWERCNKINGYGTMLGLKYTLPYMTESKQGAIVNLSSVTALVGMGLNSDTASKGAVRVLTTAAAAANGHNGDRINSVSAGVISTRSEERR